MLKAHTIGERADVVTEMQSSSWAVTGEEAGLWIVIVIDNFLSFIFGVE